MEDVTLEARELEMEISGFEVENSVLLEVEPVIADAELPLLEDWEVGIRYPDVKLLLRDPVLAMLGDGATDVTPEFVIWLRILDSRDWVEVFAGSLLNCSAPCSEATERLTQAAFPHPNGNKLVLITPEVTLAGL